jgi:hypothetical protein
MQNIKDIALSIPISQPDSALKICEDIDFYGIFHQPLDEVETHILTAVLHYFLLCRIKLNGSANTSKILLTLLEILSPPLHSHCIYVINPSKTNLLTFLKLSKSSPNDGLVGQLRSYAMGNTIHEDNDAIRRIIFLLA